MVRNKTDNQRISYIFPYRFGNRLKGGLKRRLKNLNGQVAVIDAGKHVTPVAVALGQGSAAVTKQNGNPFYLFAGWDVEETACILNGILIAVISKIGSMCRRVGGTPGKGNV